MTTTEERLKRLEEKVFGNDDSDFVLIDIPKAKFRMKNEQERDENGDRIILTYKEAQERIKNLGYIPLTKYNLFAMRDYAIQELGEEWNNCRVVEQLFGIADFGCSEWLYDSDELTGLRWGDGVPAGVFCVSSNYGPSDVYYYVGFRCCATI